MSALFVSIVCLFSFVRCPYQFIDVRIIHGSQDFPDTIKETIPPQVEDKFVGREGAG